MFEHNQIPGADSYFKAYSDFGVSMQPLYIHEDLVQARIAEAIRKDRWLLVFVIGTKPCFYKFYGSIIEAERQGVPYIVVDSNQHYDANLTYGRTEFDYEERVGIHLGIRGDLLQKTVELFLKFKWISDYFTKYAPKVVVAPVVLGDTIMTGIVPAAWLFSRQQRAIQNEAGLRSMSPEVLQRYNKVSITDFIQQQFDGPWQLCTMEPFPEQWDTQVSALGCKYLFCPTELNRQHLIREGYVRDHIFLTGGVVVEALQKKLEGLAHESIFEKYPQLAEGDWIRVDIHRRENLTKRRFLSIVGCIEELLQRGFSVNFIEFAATRYAINKYNLQDRFDALGKNPRFLYTPIWPEYRQVIDFYRSQSCFAAFTDSGGLQEEMHLLKKLCFTCRLNTDRPETVNQARSNMLVPPVDATFMADVITHVRDRPELIAQMQSPSVNLYGTKVAERFITTLIGLMERREHLFTSAHEHLKLWKETEGSGLL